MKKMEFEQYLSSPRKRANGRKAFKWRDHHMQRPRSGKAQSVLKPVNSSFWVSLGRDSRSGRWEWKDTLELDCSWPCMSGIRKVYSEFRRPLRALWGFLKKDALASLIMFMGRRNGANMGGHILKKEEILEVEPSLERMRGDKIKD